MDTQEEVAVYMCGFGGLQRCNYFREEPIRRTDTETRVRKLENGKAAGKHKVI